MKKWPWIIGILVALLVVVVTTRKPDRQVATGEQIVVKVWDWGVSQQKIYEEQFAKFMEKNPDLKIEHQVIQSGQYDNLLQLAHKNNNVPDIFWQPGSLKVVELVEMGWIEPLTEYIGKNKDNFAPNSFVSGNNVIGGEIYTFPDMEPRTGVYTPLYWNKKLFKQVGLEGPPKNWTELREYARKITKAGKGKFYGFILGGKEDFCWDMNITALAGENGAPTGGLDYRQGKYDYNKPAFIEAYKILKALEQDGSIFPGFMALDDEQARAYFATDRAAMVIGGIWNIGGWKKYPNIEYAVAPIPLPDEGPRSKRGYGGGGGPWMMSSKSKNKEAVGRVIAFLTSLEFTQACVEGGLGISCMPKANEAIQDPRLRELLEIAEQRTIIRPEPLLRNMELAYVNRYESKLPPTKTSLVSVVLEAWTTKGDIVKGLRELTVEANKRFGEMIKLARKDGHKVKLEDYHFPDFNSLTDFQGTEK